MNAILLAVVAFVETVITYSIGATLIILGVAGVVAGSRWLLAEADGGRGGRTAALLRRGSGSLALVGVLAIGLTAVFAGLAVWSR